MTVKTAQFILTAVLAAAVVFSTNARAQTRPELLRMIGQTRSGTIVSVADGDTVRGSDSSLQLVEAGLACHFTRFVNDPVLAKAQVSARTAGRGFWAAGAAKPACVKFTDVTPRRR